MSLANERRAGRLRRLHEEVCEASIEFPSLSHCAFEAHRFASLLHDTYTPNKWDSFPRAEVESSLARLRRSVASSGGPSPGKPLNLFLDNLNFSSLNWRGFYYDPRAEKHLLAYYLDTIDAIKWFENMSRQVLADLYDKGSEGKSGRQWIEHLYELFPEARGPFHTPEVSSSAGYAWLPFDVFTCFAKAIELLAEGEPSTLRPDTMGGDSHVSVDHGRSKIVVDGKEHDAELEWCSVLQALVDAEGEWRTGPQMKTLRGCKGKKIWKVLKALESAIPSIKSYLKHGGNRGYRLLNG